MNDQLPERTGPIGRIARLGWAAVFALTLASIAGSSGSARFRNPHILTEASAWFLHLMMLLIFVLTVGAVAAGLFGHRIARRVQAGSVLAVAAAVGVAGAFGYARAGSAWGFPLADLVWYFDVFVLALNGSAFILAIVLGTPGCEIGVWRELIARARGERAGLTQGLACIVGIHLIDQWEARRRRGARPGNLA